MGAPLLLPAPPVEGAGFPCLSCDDGLPWEPYWLGFGRARLPLLLASPPAGPPGTLRPLPHSLHQRPLPLPLPPFLRRSHPRAPGCCASLLQLWWAGLDFAQSIPMRAARDPEHRRLTKTGAYSGSAVICSTSENGTAVSPRQAMGGAVGRGSRGVFAKLSTHRRLTDALLIGVVHALRH
jgi:hypothetical protein